MQSYILIEKDKLVMPGSAVNFCLFLEGQMKEFGLGNV